MDKGGAGPIRGPKRDELEVGLARHEGAQSRAAPRWFVEFGGWLFAGLLLLTALGTLYSLWRGRENSAAEGGTASLVVVGTPQKVWEEGSVSAIKSVQVRVGNTGMSPAEDVRVSVVTGPKRVPLRGATQILSGKSELFSGEVQLRLRPGEELNIAVECSNCRRNTTN